MSYEAQRGMCAHRTHAVSSLREPLGVPDAWLWGRELKDKDDKRPGVKESLRWLEGYERLADMTPQVPGTRLLHVADRKADITELVRRAGVPPTPVDLVAAL